MFKLESTVKGIDQLDKEFLLKAEAHLNNLTKPVGSLGQLEELAKRIAGIKRTLKPVLKNKVIFTCAADHGVTEEGVSAYPREVTAQMVLNFLKGGAAVNVLANCVGARVIVVDMGVAEKLKVKNLKARVFKDKKINFGTKNMAQGPAMEREEAVKSIEAGIEVFEEEFKRGIDIAGTGDMGIGNTTASTAVTAALIGGKIEELTGRGTGIDDQGLIKKIEVIKKALAVNKPDTNDPIDVLSKVGGFELGGLTGIILAAACRKVPVVLDGFISGASALLAFNIEPKVRDYLIASHHSVERGHQAILSHLKLRPLLNLDMRLGEGTGAALAFHLAEASVRIMREMATFKSAGVSEKADL